jgi:aspartate racemase
MTRHIGIVAVSVEGAALCYREIAGEAAALLGEHRHPQMSSHTRSLAEYMVGIRAGDWQRVAELITDSAVKLHAAGADFLILPDNTTHQAFELFSKNSPLPWLHIAEVVAEEARTRGLKHLGVLGTKYLCRGPVYAQVLGAAGLECSVPGDPEIEKIDRIIYDELVCGKFLQGSRGYLLHAVHQLAERGCDGVVLGCTEIPLIIDQGDSPVPLLDSTRLLARAALKRAVQ